MTNVLTFPVPSSVGSLESYIQSIKALPLLTPEEEHDYAMRLKHDNDVEAARMLVMSHLRVVVSIARGYLGYGLPQADLIQEGNIGLMKAPKCGEPMDVPAYPGDGVYKDHECPVNRILQARKWGLNEEDLDV